MPIANAWVFTETKFKAEEFLNNTGNIFRLVSQRAYVSKKDPEEKGVTLNLQITKDDTDYGVDKKTGFQRDNNILNTFEVTILNNKEHLDIKKRGISTLSRLYTREILYYRIRFNTPI